MIRDGLHVDVAILREMRNSGIEFTYPGRRYHTVQIDSDVWDEAERVLAGLAGAGADGTGGGETP